MNPLKEENWWFLLCFSVAAVFFTRPWCERKVPQKLLLLHELLNSFQSLCTGLSIEVRKAEMLLASIFCFKFRQVKLDLYLFSVINWKFDIPVVSERLFNEPSTWLVEEGKKSLLGHFSCEWNGHFHHTPAFNKWVVVIF